MSKGHPPFVLSRTVTTQNPARAATPFVQSLRRIPKRFMHPSRASMGSESLTHVIFTLAEPRTRGKAARAKLAPETRTIQIAPTGIGRATNGRPSRGPSRTPIPTETRAFDFAPRHGGQPRSIMSCGHDTGDSPRCHGLQAPALQKTTAPRDNHGAEYLLDCI